MTYTPRRPLDVPFYALAKETADVQLKSKHRNNLDCLHRRNLILLDLTRHHHHQSALGYILPSLDAELASFGGA